MTVLVLHTVPAENLDSSRRVAEFELDHTAAHVASVLQDAIVCGVRGNVREVLALIDAHRDFVVFNLCEAPLGRPDLEGHIAALFEWCGVRFTGCSSETLAFCRRKDRVKALLASHGIWVPADVELCRPSFPCIVKPADEDGSAGMFRDSVCDTPGMLTWALARLPGRVLVEEYLPGREFVVSLWGEHEPDNVSIGETVFQNGFRLITYEGKWNTDSADFADTPMEYHTEISEALRSEIVKSARRTWAAVGARHCLRIDIRLGGDGAPRVLDVNPNPEMGPGAGICRAVQEAGWTWERFVRSLVEWA